MVFCEFVTACRFADCPTSRSPVAGNPTTDGVVRAPSEFGMMRTSTLSDPGFVSTTATQELVVPRSLPMTFPMMSGAPQLRRRGSVAVGYMLSGACPQSGFSSDAAPPLGFATTTMAARTSRSPWT